MDPAVRDACRAATPEVIARWRREVEENGPDWVAASKLLMAYGWGSPATTVEISRADEPSPQQRITIDPRKLTTEELRAYEVIHRAQARLTGTPPPPPASEAIIDG